MYNAYMNATLNQRSKTTVAVAIGKWKRLWNNGHRRRALVPSVRRNGPIQTSSAFHCRRCSLLRTFVFHVYKKSGPLPRRVHVHRCRPGSIFVSCQCFLFPKGFQITTHVFALDPQTTFRFAFRGVVAIDHTKITTMVGSCFRAPHADLQWDMVRDLSHSNRPRCLIRRPIEHGACGGVNATLDTTKKSSGRGQQFQHTGRFRMFRVGDDLETKGARIENRKGQANRNTNTTTTEQWKTTKQPQPPPTLTYQPMVVPFSLHLVPPKRSVVRHQKFVHAGIDDQFGHLQDG